MIKSEPFYWVECDAEGCTERCPSEGDEYSAWSDEGDAIEYAFGSDWKRTDDGKDYCYDHALNICEQCGKFDPAPLAGERDYLCVEHYAEEMAGG